MTNSLTPQSFVTKWKKNALKESAGAKEHFLDLCHLIGHATPAEMDPRGEFFTFEAYATKSSGGEGFADVWYRDHFAWEYKGKHANLQKAYDQLLQYRESLGNPPILVVCDLDTIKIHTNFTNSLKREETISLDDLLKPEKLDLLRKVFIDPEALRSKQTAENVTEQAAAQFSRLADLMRKDGHPAPVIAHFLIRLLFCLFAEDAGLFDNPLFTRLVHTFRNHPQTFAAQLSQLFQAMSTGGAFGFELIKHFDGRLFDDAQVLELNSDGMEILYQVSRLDWSSIEPTIFGTLFERSLDPSKRSQLGAHYTSRDDILLIIEPVLMAPLRREWEAIQVQAAEIIQQRDEEDKSNRRTHHNKLTTLLRGFADRIAAVKILDPACGSGNFLYLALRRLLDLEKEVVTFAARNEIGAFFPSVIPAQLLGIEINEYAHQLAQVSVQIGYIQWLRDNGFGIPSEPILKPLDGIRHMDAILAYDAEGKPCEPEWPEADVIIGNPPFLGDKKMRSELGDKYVSDLRNLYIDVPGGADLVTYWFELARKGIEKKRNQRAGLISTNSIRTGSNRKVLDRIKTSGDIFMAWDDRSWVLDGAAVRVSIVGFDSGKETKKSLNGNQVNTINSDLTSRVDVTSAKSLLENADICFLGMMKAGPFDIDAAIAKQFMTAPINPNGRRNSDVIKRRMGGQDVTGRARDAWVIDFGADTSIHQASFYELPFEYVKLNVKPIRDLNNRKRTRERWWLFGETRPGLRNAISNLHRCIVTPEVAKYRLFSWMDTDIVPDHKLHVIARSDDYFFGVLHSRAHEVWSLAQCSWMGVGNDPSYSSSRTFETFPFPWPPGKENQSDPHVQAIAEAARELVQMRDNWLNPKEISVEELSKRTLTNLYNLRPTWLDLAHRKLDQAVFAAYGWPEDLSDEEILARLLALNLERAKGAQQ